MVISLYCFNLEIADRKNNILISSYITGSQDNEKVYLLNSLSQYITTKITQLDDLTIKNYMISNSNSFKIVFDKSYISYDSTNDCFMLVSNYNGYFHKEELYYYKVIDGSVKFNYKETRYVEGRVNI